MLSNNHPDKASNIDNNFKPEGVILGIIQFISIHLPQFVINRGLINSRKIEEGYNNQLSMFFNAKLTEEVFQFQHEYERKNARKPDIGLPIKAEVLQGQYESIFDIECKRLNTKLAHVKQYVSGNTGGIERFKRNLHGTDLPYSAMIGYIENETNTYWFNQINTWIKEQKVNDSSFWTDDDCLQEIDKQYFISTHYRISGSRITLFHFLQVFTAKN